MAVTARFAADFSSFQAAVQKAEVQLRSFETGANRVEKSLGRMTDSFSGRKLIQDATLMEKAVQNVGGVSKLTTSELARIGAQATEAAEKMKKMGIEVPAGLQKIADAAKPIPQQLTLTDRAVGMLKSSFGQLFGAFTAANLMSKAVGTLTGWTAAAIRSAGATVDLADKAAVTTDTMQRMDFVARHTSTSAEAFANAAFKLSRNLAGGGQSVVNGVESLGLSYAALRRQSPDQQFESVIRALERMKDPNDRNTAGVKVFGKTFQEISQAVAQGYTTLAAQATVASDAQVRAVDRASEKWDEFVSRQKTRITSYLGDLVIASEQAGKLTLRQQAKLIDAMDMSGGIGGANRNSGVTKEQLLQMAQEAAEIEDAARRRSSAAAVTTGPFQTYAAQMESTQKKIAKLSPEIKREIKAAFEIGADAGELAERFDLNAADLAVLQKGEAELEKIRATREKIRAIETMPAGTDSLRQVGVVYEDTIVKARLAAIEVEHFWRIQAGIGAPLLQGPIEGIRVYTDIATSARLAAIDVENFWLAHAGVRNPVEPISGMPMFKPEMGDLDKFNRKFTSVMSTAFNRLPDLLIQSFTGGGGWGGAANALGTDLGARLLGPQGSFSKEISKAQGFLTKHMGGVLGGAIGSAIPAIGGLIGPALGLIGNLFGNAELKRVNRMREEFVGVSGGLAELNERAHRAGLTLNGLLDAKNVKGYTDAVNALTHAFEVQDGALITLADAEEKYHLSLDKTSADLYRNYEALISKGYGASDVLRAMKGDFKDLFLNAIKFGVILPDSIKPIAEQMLGLGQMSQSTFDKLKFGPAGDSFVSTFDRMTESVKELVATLKLAFGIPLTDAEEKLLRVGKHERTALPTAVRVAITRNDMKIRPDDLARLQQKYDFGDFNPKVTDKAPELKGFRTGTQGRYLDFGAGTDVTLHGKERVMTESEGLAEIHAGGGAQVAVSITVQAWDGASVDNWLRRGGDRKLAQALVPRLPGVLARRGLLRTTAA